MTRSLTALLGCLFLAGCPQLPPEPPYPPRLAVAPDDVADDAAEGTDEQTRQRGLRVMVAEQREIVNALERQVRFVRVGGRTTERMRAALLTSERELTALEHAIDELGGSDFLSSADRRERQDELKERLRRLAARLALMETAFREG